MAKIQSEGTCQLCQGKFKKSVMTRHLAKCIAAHEAEQPAIGKKKPKAGKLLHLVVEGRGMPMYWLHLDVAATATLYDLDAYLRKIWLECCGHLSQFKIGGTHYSVQPAEDDFWGPWGKDFEERDMNVPVGKIFHRGLAFSYEYDFGSTTELTLKVVSEREGKLSDKHAIRLLTRNDPPPIPCGNCGQPAVWIDMEDSWEPSGWLCERCAGNNREMFLPVVNSPRTGVCGYTGGTLV
jgi:hypothetical protein